MGPTEAMLGLTELLALPSTGRGSSNIMPRRVNGAPALDHKPGGEGEGGKGKWKKGSSYLVITATTTMPAAEAVTHMAATQGT